MKPQDPREVLEELVSSQYEEIVLVKTHPRYKQIKQEIDTALTLLSAYYTQKFEEMLPEPLEPNKFTLGYNRGWNACLQSIKAKLAERKEE